MKYLKIKYKAFIFAIGLSMFMFSCEQEIIQSQDDTQILVAKMANDVDVINFVEANLAFTHELTTRIKVNKEKFKLYLSEEKYEDIDNLLNISEIEPLHEDMIINKDIAVNKYPDLIDLYEHILAEYRSTNSLTVERCGTDGFTACMNEEGWTQTRYYHCDWLYCDSWWF